MLDTVLSSLAHLILNVPVLDASLTALGQQQQQGWDLNPQGSDASLCFYSVYQSSHGAPLMSHSLFYTRRQ